MVGTDEKRANHVARHLKAELKKADVGYAALALRLTEMSIPETETSVAAKINRGAFPAWFLLAVLRAIGVQTVRVEDWS